MRKRWKIGVSILLAGAAYALLRKPQTERKLERLRSERFLLEVQEADKGQHGDLIAMLTDPENPTLPPTMKYYLIWSYAGYTVELVDISLTKKASRMERTSIRSLISAEARVVKRFSMEGQHALRTRPPAA